MKKISFSLFFTFFLSPILLFAQARLTGQIDYTPANPKQFETIKVSLISYSFDVDSAQINWYVNKILVKSGRGEKNFSLPLQENGKTFYVGVDVKTTDGLTFQSATEITPHFTPLLSEGIEGYVPPFYEGRSLYGEGAKVKIVAFPVVTENGKALSKKELIFKWSVNNTPFSVSSGLSKNSFILRQDELEEENNVDVEVTTLSGGNTLTERLSVKPYEINPLFYLYDPLYGIDLSHAYENRLSINKPTKLFYSPYNFAYSKQDSYFNWSLNGLPISTDSDFLINLIPNENTKGDSTIQITATHTKKQLQSLNSSIGVHFDTKNNE